MRVENILFPELFPCILDETDDLPGILKEFAKSYEFQVEVGPGIPDFGVAAQLFKNACHEIRSLLS